MSKKGSNSELGIVGKHIEKIVLAIAGAVCLWFLVTHVVLSPNVISYDGKKLSPGNIDYRISEQADLLNQKLIRRSEPKQPYNPQADDFAALVASAVDIDTSVYLPQPTYAKQFGIQPIYALPQIGEVNEVLLEHIRAVAYVPTEEIDEKNLYGQINTKPDDIDLVTVEAKFDVAGLYERFNESFAGEYIQPEWHDPCLAEPVFAAVQLQRKQLLVDGTWSDWEDVPRTKIDTRRTMFRIIEEIGQLPPGGIKVHLLKFDNLQAQRDLLQPQAYGIASANEEWLPPSLHKKYAEYQRQLQVQEKLRVKEVELEQRQQELEERRAEKERKEQEREQDRLDRDARGSIGGDRYGRNIPTRITTERSRRSGGERDDRNTAEERRERVFKEQIERLEKRREIASSISINVIYDEFSEISIAESADFAKMRQPLVFWAHDDTIEPGKTYCYKIRLGVFNPIAGTNQLKDESKKNKVILWSEFSKETEPVEIPARLYLFANDIQEAAKTVQVQVFKYVLGHWYSENFVVRPGEVIGKVKAVELKTKEVEQPVVGIGTVARPAATGEVVVPETIDYDTGAVLVDAVAVTDWASGRNISERRYYYDMLYSFDEADIKHMPIKQKYWPKELQSKFTEIRQLEEEPRLPLRPWAGGQTRQRWIGPEPVDAMPIDTTGEYWRMMREVGGITERRR